MFFQIESENRNLTKCEIETDYASDYRSVTSKLQTNQLQKHPASCCGSNSEQGVSAVGQFVACLWLIHRTFHCTKIFLNLLVRIYASISYWIGSDTYYKSTSPNISTQIILGSKW